jgi:thioredoxin-related protein
MKNFHVLLWLLFFLGSVMLPEKSHAQLKTYQFEEIDSLQIIEKRKIVLFIHTDWCKYCQAMKNTTFKNKDIIDLLNERFYFRGLL